MKKDFIELHDIIGTQEGIKRQKDNNALKYFQDKNLTIFNALLKDIDDYIDNDNFDGLAEKLENGFKRFKANLDGNKFEISLIGFNTTSDKQESEEEKEEKIDL